MKGESGYLKSSAKASLAPEKAHLRGSLPFGNLTPQDSSWEGSLLSIPDSDKHTQTLKPE